MANPEHVAILKQGVEVWNQWRKENPDIVPDLNEAMLRDTNLRGANLRDANLTKADLTDATLRGADLERADLSDATTLQSSQLGATNLRRAKMPGDKFEFSGLAKVDELSKGADVLFLSMLVSCVYCWLTIAITKDAQLLTNSGSSKLPILGTDVPILGFYVVGPLLLFGGYIHFHFQAKRLWELLATLPAVFPDGITLDHKSHAWLLSDLVCRHLPYLKDARSPLSWSQEKLSIFLAWWIVPLTLLLFWARCLPCHNMWWTFEQIFLLCAISWTGDRLYQLARLTLRGYEEEILVWRQPLFNSKPMRIWPYSRIQKSRPLRRREHMAWSGMIALLFLSKVLVSGQVPRLRVWAFGQDGKEQRNDPWFFSPFANFVDADVSTKPDKKDIQSDPISQVKGAKLRNADLQWAAANGAFLVNADLRHTDLRYAMLCNADLRYADLRNADLTDATLCHAKLSYAKLGGARLDGTNFIGANLVGASFNGANSTDNNAVIIASLSGADFTDANLSGANLDDANLYGANLTGANLVGAFLNRSHMENAHLNNANFTGAHLNYANFNKLPSKTRQPQGNPANLVGAIFTGADLTGTFLNGVLMGHTTLKDAKLDHASMLGVDLRGAVLDDADLSTAEGLTLQQIQRAVSMRGTKLPTYLKRSK